MIKGVLSYCKLFCTNLDIEFNRQSIVVTALTGCAAVAIHSATVHKACHITVGENNINAQKLKEFEDNWIHTEMIVIDEISFASYALLHQLSNKLNVLKDTPRNGSYYGGMRVVFSGDFNQLPPVGTCGLYECDNSVLFKDAIDTILELKTNHRFCADKAWGKTLERVFTTGPTEDDVRIINSIVLSTDQF